MVGQKVSILPRKHRRFESVHLLQMRETYGASVGQTIGELSVVPKWSKRRLSQYGLEVGDLVTCNRPSYDQGVVYRIEQDFLPRNDAVLKSLNTSIDEVKKLRWCYPEFEKEMSQMTLKGYVKLSKVLELFPHDRYIRSEYKFVSYTFISKLRKVDVVQLGYTFTKFKEFLEEEVRRISGSSLST